MTFYETLTAAVNDMIEHGYDSAERLAGWIVKIRVAALKEMLPEKTLKKQLNDHLGLIYQRLVDKGGILKMHPGVSEFTIKQLKPKLRGELKRRLSINQALIKNDREQAIAAAERRMMGWGSSIPAGGSKAQDKMETKAAIKKSIASLPYNERRVIIDQGHKFTAALNDIIAKDGGAIAVIWHSHWRQKGYDYREDHKERDGHIYLIRKSWAHEAGLVKPNKDGYFDAITQPAEEVFCRCFAEYIYSIEKLPQDMLTAKGAAKLAALNAMLGE